MPSITLTVNIDVPDGATHYFGDISRWYDPDVCEFWQHDAASNTWFQGISEGMWLRNTPPVTGLKPLVDTQTEDAESESAEDTWRRLALQFDGHRMQALAHLRAMLADPEKAAARAEEFLASPPPDGVVELQERLKAMVSPGPCAEMLPGVPMPGWVAAEDMVEQPMGWYWAEFPGDWEFYKPARNATLGINHGSTGWQPLMANRYWGPWPESLMTQAGPVQLPPAAYIDPKALEGFSRVREAQDKTQLSRREWAWAFADSGLIPLYTAEQLLNVFFNHTGKERESTK